MAPRPVQHAFTLIEVLVVAGIVVVLAVLLFPVAKNVLSHSVESQAICHYRRLGTAIAQYASDNDGNLPLKLPDNGRWPSTLISYLDHDPRVYAEPNSLTNF